MADVVETDGDYRYSIYGLDGNKEMTIKSHLNWNDFKEHIIKGYEYKLSDGRVVFVPYHKIGGVIKEAD